MNPDDLSALINYMKEIDLVKAAAALELLTKKSVSPNSVCCINGLVYEATCSYMR